MDGYSAKGEGDNYSYIGYFYADKAGNYDLDVQILSDSSCLNVLHPRIIIQTSPDYSGWQLVISCLSGILSLAGISLLGHSVAARIMGWQSVTDKTPTIFENANFRIRPSHLPLNKRFSGLPPFGLFWAATLVVGAVFPMYVLQFAFRPISKGIRISVLRGLPPKGTDRWVAPIVIRVEDSGPALPPKLYLDSEPVSWDSLHNALKADLARRTDWIVYVEGDDNVPFMDVVRVMAVIRGEGAKVVLLTKATEKILPMRQLPTEPADHAPASNTPASNH